MPVTLVSWKPGLRHLFRPNFGDDLSVGIVGEMLARRGLTLKSKGSGRLLAVGSILSFARDGDVVWSSGRLGMLTDSEHKFRTLDVRSVRGPLTREFLAGRGISVPEVYGDGGMLLPMLRPDLKPATSRDMIVVPNLFDMEHVRGRADVVSPYGRWEAVIRQILTARLVVASSLHALIIADAFGIPSRWVYYGGAGGVLKFNDHYLSTGRGEQIAAKSVDEAIEMGPVAPAVFDPKPVLDAFPYDLWE